MPMGGRLGQTLSRLGNIRLGAGPAAGTPGGVSRPTDKTLPFIGHLYDNQGKFKRLLDPFLNRPMLKQTLNGGMNPIVLDMPLPVRRYADVVGGDAPASYYRMGDTASPLTDQLSPYTIPAVSFDRSAGMSFGNPGGLTGGDTTTCLKNSSAVPTNGYLFSSNDFWNFGTAHWSMECMFTTTGQSERFSPILQHQGNGDREDVVQIYIGPQGLTSPGTYGTTLQFFARANNAGWFYFSNTGYTPTPNVWHHVVLVYSSGTFTFYVDGVSIATATPGFPTDPAINRGFLVGAHPGSVQELAIYGASLSAAQVANHQAARSTGNYANTVQNDFPLGYWRLGDQVGSLVAQPTVSAIPMMLKAPVYSQAPLVNDGKSVLLGYKSGGDELSSSGAGYFASSTAKPITGSKFAIEAWIQPGSLVNDIPGSGRCIAYVGDLGGTGGLTLLQIGADIKITNPSASSFSVASGVLTTGKHHVVWVHDIGASPSDIIYLDGRVVNTNNLAIVVPPAGVAIGAIPATEANFGGYIDEVAFYNFALSAAQVLAHYKAGVDMAQGDQLTLTEQGGDGTVLYKGIIEDLPDDYDLAPVYQIGVQPMVVQLNDSFFSHNYNVPTDIAQMIQDAVNATSSLTWTGTSIPATGILAQVDFTDTTALQVLETCKKIAGPMCWWFVDQNGVVWFQLFDLTRTPSFSTKMGVDHNARRYRSPIGALKNKVLVVGNIPPNASVPITSLYSNAASQKQYGVRTLWPPLTYPNIIDQPTLDLVASTVGTELDRRITQIELELPAFSLIQLGVDKGATMRYWEPNKNPLLEAEFGSGRYSPNYVVLDVEQDGPHQKAILAEVPITSDDLKYEGDRIQQRQFLQQLLHPDLSSTVPMGMSGGFFSTTVGSPPTLPNGFTGWSLDAQNGLSLYLSGVLIARFGSQGGAGLLQSYGGYQPVDSTHRAIDRFELPGNAVNIVSKVYLSFSLKAFRATTQGTSGASSSTTSSSQTHFHQLQLKHGISSDETPGYNRANDLFTTSDTADHFTSTQVDGGHTHTNPHTHSVNAPDGLFDTGMAQGAHVYVDGTDRTTALGGPWGSGSALDVSDLDVSQWITTTGWHEIQISSTSLGVIITQTTMKGYLISL